MRANTFFRPEAVAGLRQGEQSQIDAQILSARSFATQWVIVGTATVLAFTVILSLKVSYTLVGTIVSRDNKRPSAYIFCTADNLAQVSQPGSQVMISYTFAVGTGSAKRNEGQILAAIDEPACNGHALILKVPDDMILPSGTVVEATGNGTPTVMIRKAIRLLVARGTK